MVCRAAVAGRVTVVVMTAVDEDLLVLAGVLYDVTEASPPTAAPTSVVRGRKP